MWEKLQARVQGENNQNTSYDFKELIEMYF